MGSDLGPALFTDDWEIANNVALYPLSVPFAGAVTFDSNGFAVGGADPYFTLFAGNDTAATVAGSNYDQAFFGVGGDFLLNINLAAGDYQVAMGVFSNMSSAENWGSGTLGDGFTFGGPAYLGNYYYELGVTTPDGPTPQVPEPCTLLLTMLGLTGLAGIGKKVRT